MSMLYFIFFVLLGLLAFARIGGRMDRMYRSPIYAFILAMAFIYGFMPWVKEIFDIQTYPFPYSFDAKFSALVNSLIYTLMGIVGYCACGGLHHRDLPEVHSMTGREHLRALLILGIPSFFAVLYLAKTISGYDLASYMKDRIVLRRGLGPAVILAFTAICYGAVVVTNYFTEKKEGRAPSRLRLLVILGAVFALAVAFVAMGNRNFVFILIAIVLLALLSIYAGRMGRIVLLFPALLGIAIGLSLWAKVRTTLDTSSAGTVTEVASEGALPLLVYGFNGAFGNAENLVWLASNDRSWDLLYGKTIYAALVNPIPRSLWPDKPFGGGPELRNMIYPGSYTLDGENLTSYTTGLPTEGYMNFGLLGLFLFGAFNGACLAWARNIYARQSSVTPLGVVMYSYSVFMFAFGFLYMELLGGWSRYFITMLLLSGVAWLGDKRFRTSRSLA